MVWNILDDSELDGRYRNFSVRLLAPAAASIDLALFGLYGYGLNPDGTSCAPLIPGGRMWLSGGLSTAPVAAWIRWARSSPELSARRTLTLARAPPLFGEAPFETTAGWVGDATPRVRVLVS